MQTWSTHLTALGRDGVNPQLQHPLICPSNTGLMSGLAKVGPGSHGMWGLPGVQIGAEVQRERMVAMPSAWHKSCVKQVSRGRTWGKKGWCGDVRGVLVAQGEEADGPWGSGWMYLKGPHCSWPLVLGLRPYLGS